MCGAEDGAMGGLPIPRPKPPARAGGAASVSHTVKICTSNTFLASGRSS